MSSSSFLLKTLDVAISKAVKEFNFHSYLSFDQQESQGLADVHVYIALATNLKNYTFSNAILAYMKSNAYIQTG